MTVTGTGWELFRPPGYSPGATGKALHLPRAVRPGRVAALRPVHRPPAKSTTWPPRGPTSWPSCWCCGTATVEDTGVILDPISLFRCRPAESRARLICSLGRVSRIGTDQLRDAVLDEGSFISWDSAPLAITDEQVVRRRAGQGHGPATGHDESVLTGEGRVVRGAGWRWWVCEFDFLGGSIGVAAAERITAAVERATAERLPLAGVAVLRWHPDAGRHRRVPADGQDRRSKSPCTSRRTCPTWCTCATRPPAGCSRRGVRWVNLTFAQPGALIGFLGPRVYEQLYGEPFPPGVQTAENLQRHGVDRRRRAAR